MTHSFGSPEKRSQLLFDDVIREETQADLVVAAGHRISVVFVFKHAPGMLDHIVRQITVERNRLETRRFDVGPVNGVSIADNRTPEIDRFEKGIPEAFVRRRVGHQIGLGEDVLQGELSSPIRGGAPVLADPLSREYDGNPKHLGVSAYPLSVPVAFVTDRMGNNELCPWLLQEVCQFDGVFNAFRATTRVGCKMNMSSCSSPIVRRNCFAYSSGRGGGAA